MGARNARTCYDLRMSEITDLTEAIEKNTKSRGFRRSVLTGFAQALGASIYLLVGAGIVASILRGVGIL